MRSVRKLSLISWTSQIYKVHSIITAWTGNRKFYKEIVSQHFRCCLQPLPIQVAAHFSSQVIQRRTSLTRVIWYKNEPTTYSTTMTANKINVLVLDIFRINKCSTKKSNFCFQIKTYYIFLRQWVCTVQLLWFNRTSSLSLALHLFLPSSFTLNKISTH